MFKPCHDEIDLTQIRQVCESALVFAQQEGFYGHNKHDALNSRGLNRLSLGNRFLQLGLTQAVMRCPFNLRHLLGVPKTRNAKGMALFALAAMDLFRVTQDESWRELAVELLDWLASHASREFPGRSWGYPYPWRDQGFYAPRGFPNRVVTCFVAQAFLSSYELWGRQRDAEILADIAAFLLDSPRRLFESDDQLCLSYIPAAECSWIVLDVSVLTGSVLARVGEITASQRYRDDAQRLVRYVVEKQTDYGAWYYSEPPSASPIKHDNYHTGFILDAILDYQEATGDNQFLPAYRAGLDFYAKHLFTAAGAPKWRHNRVYPHDVHGAGQGILTFSRAAARETEWLPMAHRIAGWAIAHLYDPAGHFYYQQRRFYTRKFNLLRWCNGWMARGLARLCLASDALHKRPASGAETSALCLANATEELG